MLRARSLEGNPQLYPLGVSDDSPRATNLKGENKRMFSTALRKQLALVRDDFQTRADALTELLANGAGPRKKRHLSPEGRYNIQRAMKKRWAKIRSQKRKG